MVDLALMWKGNHRHVAVQLLAYRSVLRQLASFDGVNLVIMIRWLDPVWDVELA